jgi:hypothetical protein
MGRPFPPDIFEQNISSIKPKKMKHFFLLLLLTAAAVGSQAQDTSTYPPHQMAVRILTAHGGISEGYVYAVSDSALMLSWQRRRATLYDTTAQTGIKSFGYKDLQYVTIHKRGGTGRSVLVGFLIGAVTGAIAGLASGDDPKDQLISLTASEKALGVGIFGGTVGAVTGLICGLAAHRTFVINGKKEKFDHMSRKLSTRMGW